MKERKEDVKKRSGEEEKMKRGEEEKSRKEEQNRTEPEKRKRAKKEKRRRVNKAKGGRGKRHLLTIFFLYAIKLLNIISFWHFLCLLSHFSLNVI